MFTLHKQGAIRIISGQQVLNRETVAAAGKVCDEALSQGQPRLVFDLQSVPLVDSAGVELLLDVRDRCSQRGGALHLAAPTVLVRDILVATYAISQFAVFDDALSAVAGFAQ